MSDRFYSVTQYTNENFSAVAETATTTAGNPVEVRVTYDATGNSKHNTIRALMAIVAAITKDTWPPV